MTEDITYDDLYSRYENAKHLLREITNAFHGSFQNVQNVIQQYQTESNGIFIGELSSVLQSTRNELDILFKQTSDPGLFEATKLEQQITAYQQEKKQGMEMVKNLQSTVESLQEEKRNWQIREQKGKKLIEQYQVQLDNMKNGTSNNDNTGNMEQKPLINGSTDYNEDTNVVQELTDELEIAQKNAGDMRKMVDSLSSENKTLSNQVLTLREQVTKFNKKQSQQHKNGYYSNSSLSHNGPSNVEALKNQISQLLSENHGLKNELSTYKKRLSASGGNIKQLYRSGTVTEWNESDLAAMKDEMRKEMMQQQQEMLDAQFERQFALRMPSNDPSAPQREEKEEKQQQQQQHLAVDSNNNDDDDDITTKYDRAFRDGTQTEWDPNELAELKKHMKESMQEMATKQKQEMIAKMAERNDAIRDPKEQSSSIAITPHAFNEEKQVNKEKQDDTEEMREYMQEMAMKQKQAVLYKMAERNDAIRDGNDASSSQLIEPHPFNEDNNKERKEKEEQQEAENMMAEFQRMQKEKLKSQFDTNYRNVTQSTNDISTKIVINNDDEAADIKEQMLALKKQELYRKTNTFLTTTEPQINSTHKGSFKELMQNIGILNPNDVETLWNHIEFKVNGDKRSDIEIRAHSITASQMMDNEEIDNIEFNKELEENERNELKSKIKELENELERVQQQKIQEEEDLGILDVGIETAGNNDDDEYNGSYKETPKGPDPNEIELVSTEKPLNEQQGFINFKNEMNDKINTLQQEKIAMKKHYDSELQKIKTEQINKLQQEINGLNQEIKHVSDSKIKLLINTSKEIDSLRQLLSDYVKLANQQKRK